MGKTPPPFLIGVKVSQKNDCCREDGREIEMFLVSGVKPERLFLVFFYLTWLICPINREYD